MKIFPYFCLPSHVFCPRKGSGCSLIFWPRLTFFCVLPVLLYLSAFQCEVLNSCMLKSGPLIWILVALFTSCLSLSYVMAPCLSLPISKMGNSIIPSQGLAGWLNELIRTISICTWSSRSAAYFLCCCYSEKATKSNLCIDHFAAQRQLVKSSRTKEVFYPFYFYSLVQTDLFSTHFWNIFFL